ncbi:hypothetical protein MRX96_057876 [Rhipicephalus microplus]
MLDGAVVELYMATAELDTATAKIQSSSHLQDDTCQYSACSSGNQSARDGSSDRGYSVDAASFQCAAEERAQSSSSSIGVSASCDLDVADHLCASAASLSENTSESETIDHEDIDDTCANDDANGSESDKQGAPNDFTKLWEETLPHQKTTKAQALLLVMAYIVTAGLTWALARCLLILLNNLFASSQNGAGLCPLDRQPFNKANSINLHLPTKEVRRFEVHCWNEVQGCHFVGPLEKLLWHYDEHCKFHVVECLRCAKPVFHVDLVKHLEKDCGAASSHSAKRFRPRSRQRERLCTRRKTRQCYSRILVADCQPL